MRRSILEAGFTLPELLVAGFVLLILAISAVLLIHPKDYAISRRNAQRWTDVAQLMQGLNKYAAYQGHLPDDIPGKAQGIGTENGEVNMCLDLLAYMKDLPLDPTAGGIVTQNNCASEGAHYSTGYTIVQSKDGSVTIAAPHAELNETISLTHKF